MFYVPYFLYFHPCQLQVYSGYRPGFGTIPCELALIRPEVDLHVALEMIYGVYYHLSDNDVCVGQAPD